MAAGLKEVSSSEKMHRSDVILVWMVAVVLTLNEYERATTLKSLWVWLPGPEVPVLLGTQPAKGLMRPSSATASAGHDLIADASPTHRHSSSLWLHSPSHLSPFPTGATVWREGMHPWSSLPSPRSAPEADKLWSGLDIQQNEMWWSQHIFPHNSHNMTQ